MYESTYLFRPGLAEFIEQNRIIGDSVDSTSTPGSALFFTFALSNSVFLQVHYTINFYLTGACLLRTMFVRGRRFRCEVRKLEVVKEL